MREKSEMKSHLAANMCKIDQMVPSRTVESEPENVLNTLSPGRHTRWILPHELETPNRPTSSGLQSPIGAPVQFGPTPMTREYSTLPPGSIPPAQWGDVYGRAGDDGCELFGALPEGDEPEVLLQVQQAVQHPDELNDAEVPPPPPPPPPVPHANAAPSTVTYPVQWTPLHTRPKAAGGGGPPVGPPDNGSGGSSQGNGHQGGQHGGSSSGGGAGSGGGRPPPPGGAGSGGGTGPGGGRPPPSGGGHGGGSSAPGGTPPQPTEEPVIQEALHLPLQVYRNLNVIQIHGVHSIDPENRSQS